MNRKLMIVIEETGEGKKFNVQLLGNTERIGTIPEKDYSPAEFWGARLFQICLNAMRAAGVIKSELPRQ